MKGTLHKTEQGWMVRYFDTEKSYDVMYCGESLPLHPDDLNLMPLRGQLMNDQHIMDRKEVEFEIVSRVLGASGISQTFAKLIPSKEQQKQLITDIMNEDHKDGLYDTVNDTVNELDKLAYQYNPVMKLDNEFIRAAFKAGYKKAKETLYTEEQVKLAYIQGYNRGKDGNPNHMESYIKFLKQPKKD
jgi:hypothetical protein